MKQRFVPFTPAGSCLMDCASNTREGAWKNLMKAAAHMPYKDQAAFEKRGYEVCEIVPSEKSK